MSIKKTIKTTYKIPKNFLKSLIVYGLLGFTISKLLSPIDNILFYSSRLQTHKRVKEITENYKGGEKGHFAILVSGDGAIIGNIMGFHSNIQSAYNALRKRGYKDSNIIILSSVIPKGRPLDVGITARTTPDNLKLVFEHVLRNITKHGSVTFYFTGHGGRQKEKSSLLLGGGERITQKDLYGYFRLFEGGKIFIFDQCYSGGFMKKFQDLDNIAIMASTREDKMATNIPRVERIFWDKIGKGEDAITAYRESIKDLGTGHRLAKNLIELIIRKTKNYYLVFKRGKANISRPRKQKKN
tara:strand:+ start:11764 stop:12657 length:894 start_codon:yes stop_codon:yes gene_type:complete